MTKFTKEQLQEETGNNSWSSSLSRDLAAFALSQMERAENAEYFLSECQKELVRKSLQMDELIDSEVIWKARAEKAEAERDRLRAELREAEEAIREAIEELSDGVTFEDERVSYVEMQVGREWRIEWLQSPAVRRARERAGRG